MKNTYERRTVNHVELHKQFSGVINIEDFSTYEPSVDRIERISDGINFYNDLQKRRYVYTEDGDTFRIGRNEPKVIKATIKNDRLDYNCY